MKSYCTLSVLFVLGVSLAHSSSVKQRDIPKKGEPTAFPCPDANDIFPCVCSEVDQSVDLDCSAVTSDNELAQVFQKDFPAKKLHQFTITNNYYIQKMTNIFNGVSFKIFTFTNTSLESVTRNAFSVSFDTATQINIRNSALTSADFHVHPEDFMALADLFVQYGKLTEFPSLNSSVLYSADFTGNQISAIPADSIHDETKLTFLSLRRNQLTSLESHSIPLSTHYFALYFDNNSISTIQPNTFVLPPDTKELVLHLDLRFNQLTTVDENVFGPLFPFLIEIFLAGNPLDCGCDIAWIVLQQQFISKVDFAATCADGRRVRTLDPAYYEEYC